MCGAARTIAAASATGMVAGRNSTSVRGTRTSRICRFPASNTSPTMCRWSGLSAWYPVTTSRSSCSVMTPRPTFGSPPSTVTTRFTDFDSSQTRGVTMVASRSRIGAAASDTRSERCSAIRLGASSPKTRVKNEIASVTTAIEIAEASPSDTCRASWDFRSLARVAAPNAPDSRVASVTPIWTADRNRLGFPASLAARWPRLPRRASDRIWPSRSDTSAISAAAKKPPMRMITRTMRMSQPTAFTSGSLTSAVGGTSREIGYARWRRVTATEGTADGRGTR